MLWKRSRTEPAPTPTLTGVDINASRLRMVCVSNGATLTQHFHGQDELELSILLNPKTITIGPAAARQSRITPHLIADNLLGHLGDAKAWRGPRDELTVTSALSAVFESIPLSGPFVLAVPGYLHASHVQTLQALLAKANRDCVAVLPAGLAIAMHRATAILAPRTEPVTSDEWVVPMKPAGGGPGVVAILDADDHALHATVLEVTPTAVRLQTQATWPRLNRKLWKERLLNAVSDRCVRQCRRDPRDSAVAEQALWDQLDTAMDAARLGQPVTLVARADHWHQEVKLGPADFEAFSQEFLNAASEEFRSVMTNTALPLPPKNVWLTPTAARLPGLAAMLYDHCPEGTDVAVLPVDAGAEAAAAVHARLKTGTLTGDGFFAESLPLMENEAPGRSRPRLVTPSVS